ncbi:MAG: LysM-like peptidoglycan-binding domain-containing protein, partial [Woeseiaceae bacterium]
MHRRPSPLLHDYKPSGARKPEKSKALQWFAVGVGMPLLGLFLISTLNDVTPVAPAPESPGMSAIDEVPIPEIIVTARRKPEPEPLPVFDKLTLDIGRGDTLDKLFRQNNLNLGHLAAIARLDEPRRLFRRLKPGDSFEVLHEHGSIVSMYSVLDLTSALQIERSDSGFDASIIERPIDVRKRIAHGVIDTSLFESGANSGLS